MTDLRRIKRRERAGIMVLLRWCLAAVGALLVMGPSAVRAEYNGPFVLRAAIEDCGALLERGGDITFETLLQATSDQVAVFAKNFRLSPAPEAVWSQPDGAWYLAQRGSRMCEVIAVTPSTDDMVAEWTNTFDGSGSRFRSEPVSVKPQRNGLAQARGFAARPVQDGFIQLNLASFKTQTGQTVTSVTSIRVGKSPASCELWPEECDK